MKFLACGSNNLYPSAPKGYPMKTQGLTLLIRFEQ